MKTDLSWSWGHCWVFQICWHTECSTFTASSFRIWNSSTGIPSPPLALFLVMLPKAHLTSHSRMPGSRWMITPSWLPESWRSFLYSSSVYSCHLFLISSASVSSYHFCPLLCSSLHEMFPWHLLIFLKRSLVFPILLFSSISLHWSLRKAFLSLLAIWNSAFKWVYLSFSPLPFTSVLSSAICKASSDNHFAFLHFFFLGMVLITASCTVSWTSLCSSWGTLSNLIPWIYLSCHACLFAYIPSPLPEILEILFISFWKRSLVHFLSFNYSLYQRILTSLTNSHFTPWWEVHSSSNLFLIFFPLF